MAAPIYYLRHHSEGQQEGANVLISKEEIVL